MKISKNIGYNDWVAWRGDKLIRLRRDYCDSFYSNLKPLGVRIAEDVVEGLTMEGKPFKVILPERIEFRSR
jgi:hypothetical protein